MKSVDIYRQYFSAECTFEGVERRGAAVWLTAESDSGTIRYEVGVTFFPHRDSDDFTISYDACALKELVRMRGRRSGKKDELYLTQLRTAADELAGSLNGIIHWDRPLGEVQYG